MKKHLFIFVALVLLTTVAGADEEASGKAIEQFTQVLSMDPGNVAAYIGRGTAYTERGQLDMAIEDFTEALRLDPDNAAAYLGRGNAYFYSEDLASAKSDIEAAFRLDPNNKHVEFLLDLLMFMKGR